MFALPATQQAQASSYVKGAVQVAWRRRMLLQWLKKEGRIKEGAEGKDLNWKLQYKEAVAQPYLPSDQMSFSNDNYYLPMTTTPSFYHTTSELDYTDLVMNSGPSQIINMYLDRVDILARAMQIYTSSMLYVDGNAAAGLNRIPGLATFARKSQTVATTTGDRIAPPDEAVSYGGQSIGLGSHGGTWSAPVTGEVPMNAALGTNWPDGQADPTNRYDCNSPKLYNQNTTRWANPAAAAATGTWEDNCLLMLSRAGTDLQMNTVESMMPNIHLSGSGRLQAVRDKLRNIARDTFQVSSSSLNLGYRNTLEYEGAVLDVDNSCPAQYTFSVCAASVGLFFYDAPNDGKTVQEAGMGSGDQMITGGIYSVFGPARQPNSAKWLWIMLAGGFAQWSARWCTVHGDFVNGGNG